VPQCAGRGAGRTRGRGSGRPRPPRYPLAPAVGPARRLGITAYTVNDPVKAIYRPLDVNSRAEPMAKFIAT
jgi:hypothetical protein